MHFSFKFRQLLTLSVVSDMLHMPHLKFKCRRKTADWSGYGLTIYKVYYWQFGKLWSSYYATYTGSGNGIAFYKSVVDHAMDYDGLDHGLDFILWKYESFLQYLDDMYNHDFCLDDIPDFDVRQQEVDKFLFATGCYSVSGLKDLDGDDDIIF